MRRSSPVATGCFLGLLVLIVLLGKAGQKWQDFLRGDRSALRPESTLIANFKIHRPDLERLVAMARQEKPINPRGRVVIDLGGKDARNLSQARWDSYKHLLRRVGAKHGLQRYEDGTVWIIMDTRNTIKTSRTTGFLYSPTPPAPVVSSMDSPPGTIENNLYHHIDGSWYIFRHWDGY